MNILKIILLSLLLSSQVMAQNTIELGVTKQALQSTQGKFSVRVYEEILRELGHKLTIKMLPPLRLAKQVKSLHLDGELIRMSGYGDKNPHLTKIEESTFKFSIAAYTAKENISITKWDELAPYDLAHRNGMKVIGFELKKRFPDKIVIKDNDPNKLLKLTSLKRIDIYLGVEYLSDNLIKNLKKGNIHNIKKLRVLKKDTAHLFLLNKHSKLAKAISEKLSEYKTSGKYQKIRKSIPVNNP